MKENKNLNIKVVSRDHTYIVFTKEKMYKIVFLKTHKILNNIIIQYIKKTNTNKHMNTTLTTYIKNKNKAQIYKKSATYSKIVLISISK